jgi:hypothetical protein
MLPCHAERCLSIDPDGSITALIFYDWKGVYHYVFLHTKHEESLWPRLGPCPGSRAHKNIQVYEVVQARTSSKKVCAGLLMPHRKLFK